MLYDSKSMEEKAILNAAADICAAARTAPKACGIDHMVSAVVTGEDKDKLTAEMRRISKLYPNGAFLERDAANVDNSVAVVLLGANESYRNLNEICGLCHFENCADCHANGACCIYEAMDLGIALGSAAALAADLRVDTRILFTAGKAALSLKLFDESVKIVVGIPISISGKSPFFDRAKKA